MTTVGAKFMTAMTDTIGKTTSKPAGGKKKGEKVSPTPRPQ
jgi:hypothetical protein